MHPGYIRTAHAMADRIMELIPSHPEILSMNDVFELLKLKDFHCDDINPSLAQAAWALSEAKARYLEGKS